MVAPSVASKSYQLKCFLCQRPHTEQESVTSCVECGGPIETYYDYVEIQRKLNMYALKTAPISALKYMAFYPIDDFTNVVSLEEGGTSLIHAKNLGKKLGLKRFYLKNEGMNPTGCFKDRGTMVEITKAKEIGATAICLASTGNMAASVSAYASAAGIPCYVLVPEGTALGKLAQTLTFGARVIQVRTDYSKCAALAAQMSKHFGYYLAGDYTFRTEGQKSQGYEIVEQLFWKAPDYIVCPVGVGTNLHAIYKGVKEFYDYGFIDKLPRIIAVQTPGCNPIVKAFEAGRTDYDVVEHPSTVAAAMCVGDPLDGPKVLRDIYESQGLAIEVTDEDILKAQQEQAREEGVFAEPSGAMAYAAVKQLAQKGYFKPDDVIVGIVNGNGLKDPKSPLKILPEPATVEPFFSEIQRFIEQKLYAIRESGQTEKTRVVFESAPKSEADVATVVKREFDIDISNGIAKAVLDNAGRFIEKGKAIKKSDLQYIVEEVLDAFSLKNRVLEIKDFSVKTTLHSQAEAEVWAVGFGREVHVKGPGVGPVDACLQALRTELDLKVWLVDYSVEIDSSGGDSAVEVKMTLRDDAENKIVARATSPDIIVASLKAFEKGVNILYSKTAQ